MPSFLQDLIVSQIFTFLVIFMRFGTALLIMPGIGDSFVSPQIRLLFGLAFSFVLMPVLGPYVPKVTGAGMPFIILAISEMIIGFFIGTVMRIMINALDTAGMLVSMQSGFSNAMMFNPMTATQGSIIGAAYSMLGIALLMAGDLHHFMLAAIVHSYETFPAADHLPNAGSMLETIVNAVAAAFMIGVQLSLPFIVVGLLVQFAFGFMGRLMPQIQVFFVAMPLQIGLGLIMVAMVLSASMLFWLDQFEAGTTKLLGL